MDNYEIVVVVAVKNASREIVSPTTYDTLETANAELAKITAAQRSGDEWPDVPWLSVQGTDIAAAFVRASERRGGLPDIDALVRRMREVLGVLSRTILAKKPGERATPDAPPRRSLHPVVLVDALRAGVR